MLTAGPAAKHILCNGQQEKPQSCWIYCFSHCWARSSSLPRQSPALTLLVWFSPPIFERSRILNRTSALCLAFIYTAFLFPSALHNHNLFCSFGCSARQRQDRSCHLSTAVHGLSVDTVPRNNRVSKRGKEHPKCITWLCGRETQILPWCYTLDLSLTPLVNNHLCINKPTKPTSRTKTGEHWFCRCWEQGSECDPAVAIMQAVSHRGHVLYGRANPACRDPAAPGHRSLLFTQEIARFFLEPLKMQWGPGKSTGTGAHTVTVF